MSDCVVGGMLGRSSTAVRCRALGLVQFRSADFFFLAMSDCVMAGCSAEVARQSAAVPRDWYNSVLGICFFLAMSDCVMAGCSVEVARQSAAVPQVWYRFVLGICFS
jgi:hypothetical protein